MPAEVAARLDATLADLVAARAADAPSGDPAGDEDPAPDPAPHRAPVADLAERRRRRWPRVLVAAASVSVLAYGVGIALDGVQVSGGDASTAARDETLAGAGADSADSGAKAAPEHAPTGPNTTSDRAAEGPGALAYSERFLVPRTVRLHSETLHADVRRLVRDEVLDTSAASRPLGRALAGYLDSCERPGLGRGDRVAAVRLDGRPATLVVRRAVAGTRVVQIYACDDASSLLAATEVPGAR
jgi:hypothetical protein